LQAEHDAREAKIAAEIAHQEAELKKAQEAFEAAER